MQKKLIALAIAGLAAAPVFAQSNVTVYGVADITFENVKADGAGTTAHSENRNRLSSNSSLIGFKGAEDLGNGLKALFQIEQGVTLDQSGGTFATRDSYVGLTGGFGTVVLGNLTHPIRTMGAKVDMNPGATGIGFLGAMYETFGGVRAGSGDRANNAAAYVSPSFAGLTGTLVYVAGESVTPSGVGGATAELEPEAWQVAVQYDNGPLYAGLGYHQADDPTVLGASDNTEFEIIRAAAKYTLPTGTIIAALWDNQEASGAGLGGDLERDAWSISVGQTFGAHTIHAGYAKHDELEGSLCAGGACANTDASMWTVGYEYALSKRTMLKAVYAKIKNESASNADFYTAAVQSNGTVPVTSALATGADPQGFGIGLRHTF